LEIFLKATVEIILSTLIAEFWFWWLSFLQMFLAKICFFFKNHNIDPNATQNLVPRMLACLTLQKKLAILKSYMYIVLQGKYFIHLVTNSRDWP
jgi:hypothetical protein